VGRENDGWPPALYHTVVCCSPAQINFPTQHNDTREVDLKILQDALAREAAEEAADIAAKEAKREEVGLVVGLLFTLHAFQCLDQLNHPPPLPTTRRYYRCPTLMLAMTSTRQVLHYRHQLALSMQREAQERGEQDSLIDEANRRKQAAQDAEWAAREEARSALMAEVDAIRQQQIAAKQEQRRQEKEGKRFELAQALATEQQEADQAATAATVARRKALQQSLDIKTQVMARAHMKAAEAEDKVHAAQLAQASEERFLQRVAAAEQRIAPPTFFGRKKVEWMH